MLEFNLMRSRDYWLRSHLKDVIESDPFVHPNEPPGIQHISDHAYAEMHLVDLINGYLCGFAPELKAAVDKHIAWMESQPEPDRAVYTGAGVTIEFWRDALVGWRRVLGLCRWLGRGDRAFANLTAAAAADWQLLALANGEAAEEVRADRRGYMSLHLATALTGDAPLLGLKIFEAAEMRLPMEPETSPGRFGYWACRHLLDGGSRDQTLVAHGKAMLMANLLPRLYAGAHMVEIALWLKAIYFDSGVVQAPEQAFAKAYDSMPGIPRPDFITADPYVVQ